jgi:hypothetical protein
VRVALHQELLVDAREVLFGGRGADPLEELGLAPAQLVHDRRVQALAQPERVPLGREQAPQSGRFVRRQPGQHRRQALPRRQLLDQREPGLQHGALDLDGS